MRALVITLVMLRRVRNCLSIYYYYYILTWPDVHNILLIDCFAAPQLRIKKQAHALPVSEAIPRRGILFVLFEIITAIYFRRI